MKKQIIILAALLIANFQLLIINSLSAQNIGINTTGATPNASAMLDIDATNKGILVPRIALTSTSSASPVTSPATSLLVYNTATVNDVTPGFYYWNGSVWVSITTSNSNGMHFQVFNSSGTFTVPSGVTQITVELWGGGGGGAGGGSGAPSGAGGGGFGRELFTVTPGTTFTVTVGAGGGGCSCCSPGSGGTSSFGALISATGGIGGDCSGIGGLGGTSSAGTNHFNGNNGGDGNGAPGGNAANGGGNGGCGGCAGSSPGGGGGGCSVCTGGNGASGRVIVWW